MENNQIPTNTVEDNPTGNAPTINEQSLTASINSAPGSPITIKETKFFSKQDKKDRKQNRKERKKYADFIFVFTCMWCGAIIFILIMKGLNHLFLSDLVITSLIGATTINLFGFFKIVTEYLFDKNK